MLSDEQRAEIVEWLAARASVTAAAGDIVVTGKSLDYYVGCWGTPQETATLDSGADLSVWRGQGYLFLVADYGEFRAAAVC